jgi:hypothetical protein
MYLATFEEQCDFQDQIRDHDFDFADVRGDVVANEDSNATSFDFLCISSPMAFESG